jgi:hypothetical protein
MEKGSASSDPLAKPSGVTVADAGDAKEQVQEREETTPGMAYLEALYAEAVAELGGTSRGLCPPYDIVKPKEISN